MNALDALARARAAWERTNQQEQLFEPDGLKAALRHPLGDGSRAALSPPSLRYKAAAAASRECLEGLADAPAGRLRQGSQQGKLAKGGLNPGPEPHGDHGASHSVPPPSHPPDLPPGAGGSGPYQTTGPDAQSPTERSARPRR